MRDWNNVDDRREATRRFAQHMKSNPADWQKCRSDPAEAKRQFAAIGEFYLEGEQLSGQPTNDSQPTAIPKRVEFKVYDATDPARHDLVVLVLPSATGHEPQDATDIWIAAWPPWTFAQI